MHCTLHSHYVRNRNNPWSRALKSDLSPWTFDYGAARNCDKLHHISITLFVTEVHEAEQRERIKLHPSPFIRG